MEDSTASTATAALETADPVAEVLLQLGSSCRTDTNTDNSVSNESTNRFGGSRASGTAIDKDSDHAHESVSGDYREQRHVANVTNNHAHRKLENFLWRHPHCESNLAKLSPSDAGQKTKIQRKVYPDVFEDALEVADLNHAPLRQYHSQVPGANGNRAPRSPPFGYFSLHPSTLSLHPAHAIYQYYPPVPPSSNKQLFANPFQQQMMGALHHQQQQLPPGFRQLPNIPNAGAQAASQLQLNQQQQLQMLHLQHLQAQQQQQMQLQQQLGPSQQYPAMQMPKGSAQDSLVPPPPALGPPRVSQSPPGQKQLQLGLRPPTHPASEQETDKAKQQSAVLKAVHNSQAKRPAERPAQRPLDESDEDDSEKEMFFNTVMQQEREKQNEPRRTAAFPSEAAAAGPSLNHSLAQLQNKNAETLRAVIAAGNQSTDPRAVAMSRTAAAILHHRQMIPPMASLKPTMEMNLPALTRHPSGTGAAGDKRPFSALALAAAAAAGRSSLPMGNLLGSTGLEAPNLSRQPSYEVQRLLLAQQEQAHLQSMEAPSLIHQQSTEVQRMLLARQAQQQQQQQQQQQLQQQQLQQQYQKQPPATQTQQPAQSPEHQQPSPLYHNYQLGNLTTAKKRPAPLMDDAYDIETLNRCPQMPPVREDREKKFPIDESELTGCDILLGRGGMTNHHDGNVEWRKLVSSYRVDYVAARKGDKGQLAKKICNYIRYRQGRFLQRNEDDGYWYEAGDSRARGKCAQALREGTAEIQRQMALQDDDNTGGNEDQDDGERYDIGERNSCLSMAPARGTIARASEASTDSKYAAEVQNTSARYGGSDAGVARAEEECDETEEQDRKRFKPFREP